MIRDLKGQPFIYKTRHHVAVLVETSSFGFVYLDKQKDEYGRPLLHFHSDTKKEAIKEAGRQRVHGASLNKIRGMVKATRFVDSFLASLTPAAESKKTGLCDDVIVRLTIDVKCEARFAEDIQKEVDAFAPYCAENGMFTGLTNAEYKEYDWDSTIMPNNE